MDSSNGLVRHLAFQGRGISQIIEYTDKLKEENAVPTNAERVGPPNSDEDWDQKGPWWNSMALRKRVKQRREISLAG